MTPVCALVIVMMAGPLETIPPGQLRTDSRVVADFNARVAEYVEIHRLAAAGLLDPILCADPEELARQSATLAAAIHKARPLAKEGDIFNAAVAAAFRVRIANALRAGTPILRALPDLPPELEYQIAGRDLRLVDIQAHLVVDVLRYALPAPRLPRDIAPEDACDVHPDLPVCWM